MKYYDTIALILCAGKGERTGLNYNKIFYTLPEGKSVIAKVLDTFTHTLCSHTLLVINSDDEDKIRELYDGEYVFGGQTRAQSVKNGLDYIKANGGCKTVVIHDCARPYATSSLINKCIKSAWEFGSGICAVPTTDTIKSIDGNKIKKHLVRTNLVNVQTPQAFDFEKLYFAYQQSDLKVTDDSEIFSTISQPVIVEGEYSNTKITTSNDLSLKVGCGYDVHKLVADRKLVLGGVEIPHSKGLLGHSDADVLLHAITDAVLSASQLKDIGVNFPDTDNTYKGISSAILLTKALDLAQKNGYNPVNISAVIMAQKPKLSPYIDKICKNIANICKLSIDNVNVSATTTENLGIVGEEKGMASYATVLMKKI